MKCLRSSISLSSFVADSIRLTGTAPDFHCPPNFNLDLCRVIKAALSIPVVVQGSVVDIADAHAALEVGEFVEMTRAQIADPDLVVKAARGDRPPRPCVLCNQTCLVRDPRNPVVTCVGNPSAGFETVDPDEREQISTPGAVLVVGGWPPLGWKPHGSRRWRGGTRSHSSRVHRSSAA